MPALPEGAVIEMLGSARQPYLLKNIGGVYSCTCPAWRNQSLPLERRSCKHLRAYCGDTAEQIRLGGKLAASPIPLEIGTSALSVPALLLAATWEKSVDPSGWWLSEKLDGVRAYWTGQEFHSRQGKRFYAPEWFTAGFPQDLPLDGELWLARKAFQRTVSIVRRQDQPPTWNQLSYQVFDAPTLKLPVEERWATLQQRLSRNQVPYLQLLPQQVCRGTEHLLTELNQLLAQGGEGLMLRAPGSRYEAGRSSTLLKVKRFHEAEATVVAHLPGKGRHRGRLGALLVQMPSGISFQVGSGLTDRERESPPVIGSLITYRYQELTEGGVPRFLSFVRVRTDLA